jgi:L-ascorbate metabolism protein UlaG (beta-lactamase superfamily)
MLVKYLGHSAFLIQTSEHNILIDPFIKDNPNCPINLKELPHIHYILVSHGHNDHIGDTILISKKYNSTVICNFEISLYLSKYNIKCMPMHIGGYVIPDFGKTKMVPALHGSSIYEGTHLIYAGSPCGFLLEIENTILYHAGDTGLSVEMTLLEYENIDYAMLPIGGVFTMDIDDCIKAIEFIKPKNVIPMHFNTFEPINADPDLLKSKVKSCNISILNPGEDIKI